MAAPHRSGVFGSPLVRVQRVPPGLDPYGATETQDIVLLKYDPSGELLWCKTYDGPGGGADVGEKQPRANLLGEVAKISIVPCRPDAAIKTRAGAFAVGFVAPLFEPAMIASSDWDALEQRARECHASVT